MDQAPDQLPHTDRKSCWRWIRRLALASFLIAVPVLGLPRLKKYAESVNCRSQISAICFASRLWENDNGGRLPSDFLSMSNELVSPKILVCPSDRSRPKTTTWASFTSSNSSYVIVSPGSILSNDIPVFIRCPYHGHLGYADGSVSKGRLPKKVEVNR